MIIRELNTNKDSIIESVSKTGINWSDLDVLSDSGINWFDLDVLSDAGINFADFSN